MKKIINRLNYHYKTNKTDFIRVITNVINPFKTLKRSLENYTYKKAIQGKSSIKKEINGSIMILPSDDKGLSKELILKGIREPLCTKIFLKECHKDMNVIDVGANLGYYLLMEAKIMEGGKGKIWGIEPNPKSFDILVKNVALNKYNKVILINKCIGGKKEQTNFFMSNRWNESRVENKNKKPTEELQKIQIEIDTLDNLFPDEKIDFVRMDVEGYEKNILKGMNGIIKRNPHLKIFFEYHPILLNKDERKDIQNFIENNGFKIKYFVNERRGKVIKNFNIKNLNKENFTYGIGIFLEPKYETSINNS